jgi:valyl-tRNA synthetase
MTAYFDDVVKASTGAFPRLPELLRRMVKLEAVFDTRPPATQCMQVIADNSTVILPLEGIVDIGAEKARLTKALETSTKEAKSLETRLKNPAFVEKAKPEAVEKARADHAAHAAEAERLAAALARLG